MVATIQYVSINDGYTRFIYKELAANKHYHPFLVTVRFNFIPLSSLSAGYKYRFFTDDTWNQYAKIYRFIISRLTNNFQRKQYLHPRTVDFFDVDGTRNNPGACFTETTIPHIHSIYLVHEQTLERFQTLVDSNFKSVVEHESNSPYLRTIDARPITDDLPTVVSYCSKFYDTYQARPIRDQYPLFNQFPVPKFQREWLTDECEKLVRSDRHMKQLIAETNREMRRRFGC